MRNLFFDICISLIYVSSSYLQVNVVTRVGIAATTFLEETARQWRLSERNVEKVAACVEEVLTCVLTCFDLFKW